MAVHKLFDSERRTDTESGISYHVTFYSTDFNELQAYIQDHYRHNSVTSDYGRIKHVSFRPENGFHYCDIEGWHDKDATGLTYVSHTETGPDKHEITSVCIPLPLERLQKYRTCWNHYLWAAVPGDSTSATHWPPSGYQNTADNKAFMSGGTLYAWTDGIYPPSMDPGTDGDNPKKWIPCSDCPTKPGVTHVEYYTYQITEEGDHSNLEYAYWVMKSALNKPVSRPLLGSMGVTGGAWKCDHASIVPNGKRWRSRLVWTWAPGGWDSDLYPVRLKTT